jgi:hypothetical protein
MPGTHGRELVDLISRDTARRLLCDVKPAVGLHSSRWLLVLTWFVSREVVGPVSTALPCRVCHVTSPAIPVGEVALRWQPVGTTSPRRF